MNALGATAPLWLAYAFGFGLASALVDAAMKSWWLGGLFLAGGVLALGYAGFQSLAREMPEGLNAGLIVAATIAAGYGLVTAALLIAQKLSGAMPRRVPQKSERA